MEAALTGMLAQGDVRGLALDRVISQATFDEAVRENVDEFEMSEEEAVSVCLSDVYCR
jgi:hypothetical protein